MLSPPPLSLYWSCLLSSLLTAASLTRYMNERHEPIKNINEWSEREAEARDKKPGRLKLVFVKMMLTSANAVAELMGRMVKLTAQKKLITERRKKAEDSFRRKFR